MSDGTIFQAPIFEMIGRATVIVGLLWFLFWFGRKMDS